MQVPSWKRWPTCTLGRCYACNPVYTIERYRASLQDMRLFIPKEKVAKCKGMHPPKWDPERDCFLCERCGIELRRISPTR